LASASLPIQSDIADAQETAAAEGVRRFYDVHPYPPPVTDLDDYRALWMDLNRRRADYHMLWPAQAYREDQEVLVAGCGTSQAAKVALRQPGARVTGIDVSATSIHHVRELKLRYDLMNLELYQLPIERVRKLEREFDKIICTGVLHHLPDPDVGLRALRSVLRSGGAMVLMVYAPYGRAGIYMLQDYCRRLGIGTSDQELHDLAAVLMELPAGHPLEYLLSEAQDFRHKAGLADALLHPQDRAYSVPQLFAYLERCGVSFGRWVRQAPYLAQCGALAKSPHGPRLTQLPAREAYAAVELFRGTMVRHSAVVYRDDHPGDVQPVRFDDGRWRSYVPIPLPRTLCVEDRLPPDAAGVLINQSHTYADLFLPIDAYEKTLFQAIDGKRTIAEIVDQSTTHKAGRPRRESARGFFERLWQYDQVVFDACPRE
jgi:SAM-dependent methyltransferase